jgi:predicted amidohydrolase
MAGVIRVAALQMNAMLGDARANLDKADLLVEEAAGKGARIIILPEFFTSAVAYHPSLPNAILPFHEKALALLVDKAKKHKAYVGGSFIVPRDGDLFNTFFLAMPDGTTASHDKDQPTMWENCYYIGGHDDGILETPMGPFGAVLCWEFIRNRTVQRLLGKVDLVVGGSCWWTVPQNWPVKWFWRWHHDKNTKLMASTPSTLSRLLGVPVIHSAHAGDFKASMPMIPGAPYDSFYLGEAQIVDKTGTIIARRKREEGDGVITGEIELDRTSPSLPHTASFWIPRIPVLFRMVWTYQNAHGRRYYRKAGYLWKGSQST